MTEIFDAAQQTVAERGWYAAGQRIARGLREQRALRSSERRLAGDALHGMVRGLRRLRSLCIAAGIARPAARHLYLVWLVTHPAARPLGDSLARALSDAGLALDPLLARAAELDAAIAAALEHPGPALVENVTTQAEALSYPDWLLSALAAEHGLATATRLLLAQNQRAPLTLRANLLRGDRAALRERLRAEGVRADPGLLAATSLIVNADDARVNVYGLAAFTDGWLELQDEGSQLIAELCSPPPGGVVVDACAGAGGKTLALGALLGNRGRLLALDSDADKLTELRRRARRAGLTNVQARTVSPEPGSLRAVAATLGRGAARVLCDVPCAGLGVLRRNAEARWRLTPQDLRELPQKQRAILDDAAALVAPGGRLIYATCTIDRAENDDIVAAFLAAHPEFRPQPAREILGRERTKDICDDDGVCLRLLPGVRPAGLDDALAPDGFFAVALRRAE